MSEASKVGGQMNGLSPDSLSGTHRPQGIPFAQSFQERTLELRPPVQQLAQAGDPGLDDSSISLPQRNQFQQKQKISKKRTKTLSTKRTLIVALYTYITKISSGLF